MNSFDQVDAELAVRAKPIDGPILDYLAAFNAKDGDLRHGKGLSSRRQALQTDEVTFCRSVAGLRRCCLVKRLAALAAMRAVFAHRASHRWFSLKMNAS